MRIDEFPYHSSLFYKLNFVSRRQFFINIRKYPSKMQKVRNDPFLGNKIFKRRALFSDQRRFLWRLLLWLEHSYVLRSSSIKSPFCPTSETPSGRIQCYVWFPLLRKIWKKDFCLRLFFKEWWMSERSKIDTEPWAVRSAKSGKSQVYDKSICLNRQSICKSQMRRDQLPRGMSVPCQ